MHKTLKLIQCDDHYMHALGLEKVACEIMFYLENCTASWFLLTQQKALCLIRN